MVPEDVQAIFLLAIEHSIFYSLILKNYSVFITYVIDNLTIKSNVRNFSFSFFFCSLSFIEKILEIGFNTNCISVSAFGDNYKLILKLTVTHRCMCSTNYTSVRLK
jgi:hypothetical protein